MLLQPTNQEETQNFHADYKLIVNGKDIAAGAAFSINHEKQYAEIPLTATLRALGCPVEWENENRVKITCDDAVYILNPSEQTLEKAGDSFNLIAVAPGATHGIYCKISDREFIIDSDTVSYFLSQLGAQITIDYDSNTVVIEQETEKCYSVEPVSNTDGALQYEVTVFGQDKSTIYETVLYAQPQITVLEDGVLRMHTGAGNVTQYSFFDTGRNKVSPVYDNPELVQDGKIVYMTLNENKTQLVVRDIFDETVFYRVYDRDFSKTAVPADALVSAVFTDENTLQVTYLTGKTFKPVSETLYLA